MNKKAFSIISTALIGAQCFAPLTTLAAEQKTNEVYKARFEEMYKRLKDTNNGYFSKDGVPYHSLETINCEAPDQGHESTSEAASYYVWLEAMNGRMTGNYDGVTEAWRVIDNYFIPTSQDQPGQDNYNPNSPATYAAEYEVPTKYPSQLKFGTPVGQDPLYYELKNAYGTSEIYGMHWLIDCDNFYGYGRRGDGKSTPSYINTFQRGKEESTFETIPQPSWEDFSWGGSSGFLPFFTIDNSYSKQWRYTNAPDADARTVQAMYWAKVWGNQTNKNLSTYTAKAGKMGDYLRYAMFDKYFIKQGAQSQTAAQGYDSAAYLLSWYYAWGGGIGANWSWRIGSSHNHFGYQSPMAAWILSTDGDVTPKSANGKRDWDKSLQRQLEFYQWLQSAEGGIAGGATNSYEGQYQQYPAGTSTFYGMAYQEHPVYADPGSNRWFGMQAWSMQRMAEYYYATGDAKAQAILDKWAAWVLPYIHISSDKFEIPSNLGWSGQPDTWTGSYTGNSNLHVTVDTYGEDLGVAGSLADTLFYYAAATAVHNSGAEYKAYAQKAQDLIDCMYENYLDEKGIAVTESRADYLRMFTQEVYVPANYTGRMASGDQIKPGVTFLDIRSQYKNDPDFPRLEAAYEQYKKTGVFDFTMTYHRFWAQCDFAIANGVFAILFPEGVDGPVVALDDQLQKAPVESTQPTIVPTTEPTIVPTTAPTTAPTTEPTTEPTTAPTVAPTTTPVVGTVDNVKVDATSQVNGNSVSQVLKVSVTSGSADLSNVVIRQYFTKNDASAMSFWCDNAGLQLNVAPWYTNLTGSTTGTFGSDANGQYVDITFSNSQVLQAGTGSLDVQIRYANSDWSNFSGLTMGNLVVMAK